MTCTIHIISDLNLNFNEFTPKTEETIPDVDLVILNGNLSNHLKRSMLYAEYLCEKYPRTQFVYNIGLSEFASSDHVPKNANELFSAMKTRSQFHNNWFKNLHFIHEENKEIELRNGVIVDVFATFGYPKILKYEGHWYDHIWFKKIICDATTDINHPKVMLPKNTSKVSHGHIPIWAYQEWVNEQHTIINDKLQKWVSNSNATKILVSQINPINDTRCEKQTCEFYDINFEGIWVSSNTRISGQIYSGAKLYSNPGRGIEVRNLVVTLDNIN